MKIVYGIIIGLLLVISFFTGYCIKQLPHIDASEGLSLYQILHLLLIATVGLIIPFLVKRWIDNSNQVRNLVIDELKECLKEVEIIKDKFRYCYSKKSITQGDKQELNVLFEQADLKMECLEEQCNECYPKKSNDLIKEIKEKYMKYWKLVTCAELMATKYKKIDESMYSKHNTGFNNVEKEIKKSIRKISKV